MSHQRPPAALLASLGLIAISVCACNLGDPLSGERPTTTEDAGTDSGPTDMPVAETGDEDMEPPPDGSPPDGSPPDAAPDMSGELTVATFFDRYFTTYCETLERLDLQFNDLYWWETVDDCLESLQAFIGMQREFIVHDAEMGRLTLDVALARSALTALEAVDHPADFEDLDFDDVFVAQADLLEPCASQQACIDTPTQNRTCLKPAGTTCEGVCGPNSLRCGDAICGVDEYCESAGNCLARKADGETCSANEECENLCLSSGAGARVCGVLADGDGCAMNPNGCDEGLFCDMSLATPTCVPQAADGQPCTVDDGCTPDSICAGGTCEAIVEGSPCRNLSQCPSGLRCVRIDAGAPDRACFSERAEGDPCLTDAMCSDDNFCNTSQFPAVCAPERDIGMACRFPRECRGQLTCRRNDFATDGSCEMWTWGLGEGETCFENAAACSWGLYCEKEMPDSLRGTCTARTRPEAGEACLEPLECVNAYCDSSTDMCEIQGVIGEACSDSTDCRSLTCDEDSASCIAMEDICP